MGWEHEPETVWKAQELYCHDRLSFARVAELTQVSATTLKAWADKFHWRAKREEIAQLESEIRVNTIKGRAAVLQKLIHAEDGKEASQAAFAVASLESLALKQAELAASGKLCPPSQSAPVPVGSKEDMIAALRQAVETRVAALLTGGEGINLAAVKDVLACMDMLARYVKPEGDSASAALSAANAQALREALGL